MRKIFLSFAALALILTGCESDNSPNSDTQESVDMSDFYLYTDADIDETSRVAASEKSCYSMVNLNRLLRENPGLYDKMYDIELNTRKSINAKKPDGTPGGGNGGGDTGGGGTVTPSTYAPVTINVVVNILETSSGAVSNSQITSQIAILNDDFNDTNPNRNSVPSYFADYRTDASVNFNLVKTVRKTSSRTSWGTNDEMKKSSAGGIDPTDTANNLNIWVCEIGGGILGYAQFPGGPAATDGVVIGSDYFGNTTAGGVYGKGRTATHEVGHYLNLRHIWGDGRCRQDDFVADTPSSDGPNYGCPGETTNCSSIDMTMNYMDYVYDDCMYMFTHGQNDRMHSIFEAGGSRVDLVN
ncbi:Pregnancy-associated plasma protein-A [Flavobacteriaceae bacterium MAR_2010_188]|nr:Pregnancy-associated plasma protein-A [Flavobacteriaceae bacterium MAR_2010_188]